jgi:hypothetical protein
MPRWVTAISLTAASPCPAFNFPGDVLAAVPS